MAMGGGDEREHRLGISSNTYAVSCSLQEKRISARKGRRRRRREMSGEATNDVPVKTSTCN